MTCFETVIRHISQGTTYSWDLTVLLGLGLALSLPLRQRLLQGGTSQEDAAYVTSMYTGKLLRRLGR
ncbi:hypothetical protein EZJ19_13920 [Parasulfuritortus cantonensis]|uniref:Uncharacterized protein n=1 Tax=Parasulfuritortus cantonensis TaxID=2528202 RepID=A0A4R1B7H4_9PROT|nr:hypothetical protein [Parasulfuritortus cantonensis]TCJ11753.1 hypothetical protein EZJ19_13920 [Parasulfuritortus cantonensis]